MKKEMVDIKKKELSHVESEKTWAKANAAQQQLQFLQCKICKTVPTPPIVFVTCCKKVIGCEKCFANLTERQKVCPLCQKEISCNTSIPLRGLEQSCDLLRQQMQ